MLSFLSSVFIQSVFFAAGRFKRKFRKKISAKGSIFLCSKMSIKINFNEFMCANYKKFYLQWINFPLNQVLLIGRSHIEIDGEKTNCRHTLLLYFLSVASAVVAIESKEKKIIQWNLLAPLFIIKKNIMSHVKLRGLNVRVSFK